KQCDVGDKYWSDQDGEFFTNIVSPNPSANKDDVNELVDALDDLVDENGVVEVEKDLSQMLKKRVAEQRRLRLQKRLEEENSMKIIYFSKSTHMKLTLDKCGTNKRMHVNVLKPPIEEDTDVKVLSIDTLKKVSESQTVGGRGSKSTIQMHRQSLLQFCLEQFLITSGWRHCKFPWCNEIVVDRPLWDSLIGLDDKRLGWLVDDHTELWVWYMWHFRQSCHDWSIVSCYFFTLLLQDSMSLFFATDEIYPLAWRDVEQVFIPINKPKRHWSLAQFHIQYGNVTFYDSQKTYDVEYRSWYVKMRSCLESKLPFVLQ
ncbi:phospholipase-like protein, partial [Tanacetum coccineum]